MNLINVFLFQIKDENWVIEKKMKMTTQFFWIKFSLKLRPTSIISFGMKYFII